MSKEIMGSPTKCCITQCFRRPTIEHGCDNFVEYLCKECHLSYWAGDMSPKMIPSDHYFRFITPEYTTNGEKIT